MSDWAYFAAMAMVCVVPAFGMYFLNVAQMRAEERLHNFDAALLVAQHQPRPQVETAGCSHPNREVVTLSLTGEAVGSICTDPACMASIPPSKAFS